MKYKCPECKTISDQDEWLECEVGCGDCGSHPALRCPMCRVDIGIVYFDLEEYD